LDSPESVYLAKVPFEIFALGNGARFKYRYNRIFGKWLEWNIGNYDVVIIEGVWQNHSRVAAKIAFSKAIPYYVVPHGMLAPWFKSHRIKFFLKTIFWLLFERHVINNADKVLFTCKQEMYAARDSFRPYTPNEAVVTLGCAEPPLLNNEVNNTLDYNYFIFLGRLDPIKALDNLIVGYSKARLKNNSVFPKLLLVGPSSKKYESELKSLVIDCGVSNDVIFFGPCFSSQKWELMRNAQALILPSHHENFGMVVCESIALGIPVLISENVNIQKEIISAGAGLVFKNTPFEISSYLLKFNQLSPIDVQNMSKSCIKLYRARFTNKAAAKELESVLLTGLGNKEI
jgi:glycosyltransferase involved in cell wall biosynthesis